MCEYFVSFIVLAKQNDRTKRGREVLRWFSELLRATSSWEEEMLRRKERNVERGTSRRVGMDICEQLGSHAPLTLGTGQAFGREPNAGGREAVSRASAPIQRAMRVIQVDDPLVPA
mgnify:CR=1 FL=1